MDGSAQVEELAPASMIQSPVGGVGVTELAIVEPRFTVLLRRIYEEKIAVRSFMTCVRRLTIGPKPSRTMPTGR